MHKDKKVLKSKGIFFSEGAGEMAKHQTHKGSIQVLRHQRGGWVGSENGNA